MNWFYAQGGQRQGPVSQEDFDRLVATGVITDSTLVWRSGMGAWEPWSSLRPIGTPPQPRPDGPATIETAAGSNPAPTSRPDRVHCASCGGEFAIADTLLVGERRLCAACRPILSESASPPSFPPPQMSQWASYEAVLARDYQVNIGSCFDRAHQLVKADFGLLLGALVLAWLIIFAGGMVPCLGMLAAFFLTGPLMGGVFLIYLARLRGRPAMVGMIFDGFSTNYWDLVLCHLVPTLLGFAVFIPIFILAQPAIMLLVNGHSLSNSVVLGGAMLAVAGFLGVAVVIASFYFYTCWIFSMWLTADKKLPFWSAMELSRKVVNKHWRLIFLLYILSSLVMTAGALLCLIGLIYTGPLVVALWARAYEDIFGDLAPHAR
jgi:hypothetical protein